jgi:hypothetical protein
VATSAQAAGLDAGKRGHFAAGPGDETERLFARTVASNQAGPAG